MNSVIVKINNYFAAAFIHDNPEFTYHVGITLFTNQPSTFCWFNALFQLILEMQRASRRFSPAFQRVDRADVTVEYTLDIISSCLVTRENGKIINPTSIIEKIAMLYMNVHPYVVPLFLSEQQEAESFLDCFLLGKIFHPLLHKLLFSTLYYSFYQ